VGLFDGLVSAAKSIGSGIGRAAGGIASTIGKVANSRIGQQVIGGLFESAIGRAPGGGYAGGITAGPGGFAGEVVGLPSQRVFDPSLYGGAPAGRSALDVFMGGLNAPAAGRSSTLSPSVIEATGGRMAVYRSTALPGGALVASGLGALGRAILPAFGGAAAGAGALMLDAALSPRGRGMPRLIMQTTPAGNPTWYRHVGQPVLFSGDLATCKRVRKIAGRARRSGGR